MHTHSHAKRVALHVGQANTAHKHNTGTHNKLICGLLVIHALRCHSDFVCIALPHLTEIWQPQEIWDWKVLYLCGFLPFNSIASPGKALASWAQMVTTIENCWGKERVIDAFVPEVQEANGYSREGQEGRGEAWTRKQVYPLIKAIFSHIINQTVMLRSLCILVVVSAKVAPRNNCHMLKACWKTIMPKMHEIFAKTTLL